MRDDTILIQLLKTLYDRQNEDDENTGENTLIQYFEAPHDATKVSGWVQVYTAIAALQTVLNEQIKITAGASSSIISPNSLRWAGYDSNGKYADAGWNWDYGGVWK